jgi:hypothetical protein
MKGMGLEHINGPAPVIPEKLSKTTLRDPGFQVCGPLAFSCPFLLIFFYVK